MLYVWPFVGHRLSVGARQCPAQWNDHWGSPDKRKQGGAHNRPQALPLQRNWCRRVFQWKILSMRSSKSFLFYFIFFIYTFRSFFSGQNHFFWVKPMFCPPFLFFLNKTISICLLSFSSFFCSVFFKYIRGHYVWIGLKP